MNAQQSPPSSSSPGSLARYAVWAWIVSLAVFLVWLVLTVAGGPPSPSLTEADKKPTQQEADVDRGFIVENLPAWGSEPTPSPPFEIGAEYVLTGYGLQGFYQNVQENTAWTLELPKPTLAAQLFKRGTSPSVVTENVVISWEMDPLTEPEQSTSEQKGSTLRRGDMKPSDDGLSFTAHVPVTAMKTGGGSNPYPVVRIFAKDADSGALLAESAAVIAVAPGFGCGLCHADAEFSILEVHDRHQSTELQEQVRKGVPVNCRTCHDGATSKDGKTSSGIGMSVSAAIHGWHSQYLSGKGAESCMACHAALGRSADDKPDDHRPRPLFARDLHIDRGLSCVNCHGVLEDHALSLLQAEKMAGQQRAEAAIASITPRSTASIDEIKPRLPWKQLPDCTGCHNFETKPHLSDASGFNTWTEDEAALFSRRADDMSMLRCLSCHGAPHAVYPAANPVGRDRDNIVPIQYQQHAKVLGAAGNCNLCHMQDMDMSAHHPLVERKRTQIYVPSGAELSQPRVHFAHSAHSGFECQTCHHKGFTDGSTMMCATAGCHDGAKAIGDDGKEDPMYFRRAFHGPTRSCFYCHSESRQQGKPAGPVACKDCHSAPSPRWALEEASDSDQPKEDSPHMVMPSSTADSENAQQKEQQPKPDSEHSPQNTNNTSADNAEDKNQE